MYTPNHFKNTDDTEIREFIRQNGFGILVNQTEGNLWATHIPMELSDDGKKLSGHVSRANKQWKGFSEEAEVLVIFNGPHAYVSSSWYNHEAVPTWNYIAVHVYGKIKIIEGEQLYSDLKQLMNKYEKTSARPVVMEKMSPEYIQQLIKGVVGFEITVSKIEATYKLSQNRNPESHANIIQELEKRPDAASVQVAEAMKKTTNGKTNVE